MDTLIEMMRMMNNQVKAMTINCSLLEDRGRHRKTSAENVWRAMASDLGNVELGDSMMNNGTFSYASATPTSPACFNAP